VSLSITVSKGHYISRRETKSKCLKFSKVNIFILAKEIVIVLCKTIDV